MTTIKYYKPFNYSKRVPTLMSINTSGYSEIARWVLDLNEIQYIDKNYPPIIGERKTGDIIKASDVNDAPVFIQTDRLIYTSESIIHDFDETLPESKRLFPVDANLKNEVYELYNLFTTRLYTAVERYRYSELFRSKKSTLTLLKQNVSYRNRLKLKFGYSTYKKIISKRFNLNNEDPIVFLAEVKTIFTQVNELLSDGRKYLSGNQFSAADLAFAAIAAPVILPVEYGGTQTKFNEISEELRHEIMLLRTTPAGQFVLKMYQEERPINLDLGAIPKTPNLAKRILNRLIEKLASNQGTMFYFLQKRLPLIKIGLAKIAIVSRHDLVVNILNRDVDFTIKEINAKKMADQKGTFFLGMDRNNPQFDRERNYVRKATHKDDLDRIRVYVRNHADTICKQIQPYGKLDVVQTLNYNVLLGVLNDYFGVPAPVKSRMKKWQRTMFYDLFLNFTGNKDKHLAAVNSGKERTVWVRSLIDKSKKDLEDGKTLDDNLLNRLILMQKLPEYSWVDDDIIRRNIGGLLTGLQETTSKAVIYALQELFKRPQELKGAITAAKAYNMEVVKGYVYEALRFNPVQPGVLRFNETKQFIKGSGNKTYTIKGNRKIMALTSGAMFDPVTFPDPKTFKSNRESRYMNWGFALHECYGKYINSVTIPELVAAVLRLENVTNAKGSIGRASGLTVGPFPNNYVVTFNSLTN
jgi:cytochrome P450/glutathione S-transferase